MGLIFVLLALRITHIRFSWISGSCVRRPSSQKAMFLDRVHLEAAVGCPGEVAFLLQNKQRNSLYRELSLFPSAIQEHQN